MKLSSPRWLSKKPSGAKPQWVKLSRVPPKRWDMIHSHFITSRHFRINRRLCKRLHSKATEAVQRVHQTLPSLCRSGLARETTLRCEQNLHGPFLRVTLPMRVGSCTWVMADNGETKGLITPPSRWVSAQLLYVVSLHDSDHEGVVRIFVALSCEL